MLLRVILMIGFEILSDFLRKSQKMRNMEKSGIFGFLRCSVGCPRHNEAKVPKRAPLGYTTA